MFPVLLTRITPAGWGARVLVCLAAVLVPLSLVLAFAYAPMATIPLGDGTSQSDWPQKIFYLHVPVAFAAYLAFAVGAWNALLYLLTERPEYDLRSYVGVHMGLVLGTLVLVTGSIWARAAWGVWWQWNDKQLLVFLILYLFYASYFMLRFSLDPGRLRARASAVFALIGVALVPLSFLAIRIADSLIHPIVIERDGLNMTGEMAVTFILAIVAFQFLAIVMMQIEAGGKIRAWRIAVVQGTPTPVGAPIAAPGHPAPRDERSERSAFADRSTLAERDDRDTPPEATHA